MHGHKIFFGKPCCCSTDFTKFQASVMYALVVLEVKKAMGSNLLNNNPNFYLINFYLILGFPTFRKLISLPPEKILLRWMNFQLMLTSYKFLHPEHSKPYALDAKDPFQRAKLVLAHTNRMGCKRYLTAKDIAKDETQISREESVFCFWINSFGNSIYINNVLLETLEKLSPGIVSWKIANKPPIKIPFRKSSLLNIAGNDIVQGNKNLILAHLWKLIHYNILQLLKNLRFHSHGKEITDVDILEWANAKVSNTGSQVCMDSFKLQSVVQPRVVNWSLTTKGVTEEHKKMNSSYIISTVRKLGCSIFLLPEDITDRCSICFFICSVSVWSLFSSKKEEGHTRKRRAPLSSIPLFFGLGSYLCFTVCNPF
ncbi:hypothetical protein UlMin_020040 [Ulmus minor]